jgi:hypothetical protein
VSYSPALKWFVVLLFPLTFAGKFNIIQDEPKELKSTVVEFLLRHNFKVSVDETLWSSMPVIEGTTNTCRMVLAEVPAQGGSNLFLFREFTKTTDVQFEFHTTGSEVDQLTWSVGEGANIAKKTK